MKTGVELIAEERERQINGEGYTAEHDAQHTDGSMATAGAAYALHLRGAGVFSTPLIWPWEREAWKPSDDPIRNLQKAGALIAAEIDRRQKLNEELSELPV